MKNLAFVVRGDGPFPLRALDLLYELGHLISACISSDAAVAAWAAEHDVPVLEPARSPSDDGCELQLGVSGVGEQRGAGDEVTLELCCRYWIDEGEGWAEHVWHVDARNGARTALHAALRLPELVNGADLVAACLESAMAHFSGLVRRLAQGEVPLGVHDPEREQAAAPVERALSSGQAAAFHRSNCCEQPFTRDDTLVSAFRRATARYPENCALMCEEGALTYAELDALSERIAALVVRECRKRGVEVGPGSMIGVSLPKSIELYAAILGVLKCGAAYVPLDPEYPEERLRYMVEDCECPLILTLTELVGSFPASAGACVDVRAAAAADSGALDVTIDPSALAVVIFTSGSTGRAKGTLLDHGNIVHFSEWYRSYVALDDTARPLQFSTISFDASLLDIFPTLFCGAALIVPTEVQRRDFEQLSDLVERRGVTHAFLPPALLAHLPACEWRTLRQLITGGDVCDPHTIQRWSDGRNFHNIYGPTECTVLATTIPFHAGSSNRNIGKPIANTRCYVLDPALKPVRTGQEGELYIAGFGVGRGYWKRPELTAERFVDNPLSDDAGYSRLYKTGDLARWTADGCLEFVGRVDSQVKIRGFRVELGEVESAILLASEFRHAAVVATSDKHIIAYVAPTASDGDQRTERLKTRLKSVLPEYMLPAAIVQLDVLPATPNGKIDRARLTKRDVQFAAVKTRPDRPTSPAEQRLVVIWADVLGLEVDEIGVNDSFFDLGGHSLLVSKMLLAVKRSFSRNASLARFMENATIASLAALLTNEGIQKGAQLPSRVFADAQLEPSILPPALAKPPSALLLTGATGFLGAFILEELVRQTAASITCLVRAKTPQHARERLDEALNANGLQYLVGHPRIRAAAGDIERARLGLSEDAYAEIAATVDGIYHNGANVNHVYDYPHLYDANVRSTNEVLRLAVTGKAKSVFYVSTISAASRADSAGRLVEDGPARIAPAFVNNGYNVSKWVSEQLVWEAMDRGVHAKIFRPGNITGHSQTGLCHPRRNRILLVIKGCLELAAVPAWDMTFDVSPVDYLARSIVALASSPSITRRVFHLHNPKPLTWIEYVSHLRALGYAFELVDPREWRARLLGIDESSGLYDVVSFYLDEKNEDIGDIQHIDFSATECALRTLGIEYPEKDRRLLLRNFEYLMSSGFLPQASAQQRVRRGPRCEGAEGSIQ